MHIKYIQFGTNALHFRDLFRIQDKAVGLIAGDLAGDPLVLAACFFPGAPHDSALPADT